jgi:hypothetical protein
MYNLYKHVCMYVYILYFFALFRNATQYVTNQYMKIKGINIKED